MAVGCSLGAHRLCCALGEDGPQCVLDAACCVQAPMMLWRATSSARQTMKGFYDRKLGENMHKLLLYHKDILGPHMQKVHNIDLVATLE
jgi:predicted alpha/beta-fold hydrolase